MTWPFAEKWASTIMLARQDIISQPFRPARADAKFCSARCKQAAYRARRVTDIPITQVSIRGG